VGVPEYRFLVRVMVRSAIGEESYCPRSILEGREGTATHHEKQKPHTDVRPGLI
jgi:3-ketoacyl-CoA synthase